MSWWGGCRAQLAREMTWGGRIASRLCSTRVRVRTVSREKVLRYACPEPLAAKPKKVVKPDATAFSRRCPFGSLKMLHLRPEILDRIEVWRVAGPSLEKLDSTVCVPFLRRIRAMRWGAVLHEQKRTAATNAKEMDDVDVA